MTQNGRGEFSYLTTTEGQSPKVSITGLRSRPQKQESKDHKVLCSSWRLQAKSIPHLFPILVTTEFFSLGPVSAASRLAEPSSLYATHTTMLQCSSGFSCYLSLKPFLIPFRTQLDNLEWSIPYLKTPDTITSTEVLEVLLPREPVLRSWGHPSLLSGGRCLQISNYINSISERNLPIIFQ